MLPEVLINALRGISTCATECGCCEMHKRIAENALTEYLKQVASAPAVTSSSPRGPAQT